MCLSSRAGMIRLMKTLLATHQAKHAEFARAAAARSRASRARAIVRQRIDECIVDGLEEALAHVGPGITAEALLKLIMARSIEQLADAGIEQPKAVFADRLRIARRH